MASLFYLILFTVTLSISTLAYSTYGTTLSPLTPKATLIRYWNRKVPNNKPHPSFFLSKLSPLSPVDLVAYSSLSPSGLASKLSSFCYSAHLLCSSSTTSKSHVLAHDGPLDFLTYVDSNFTGYATKGVGVASAFSNYSGGDNGITTDTFRRYSRDAVAFVDSFTNYSDFAPLDGGVVTTNFTSYSGHSQGGSGAFTSYHKNANVPELTFTAYDTAANGPDREFKSYAEGTNSGDENFSGYGKHGSGIDSAFAQYSDNSNGINSGFSNYGEDGNSTTDNFATYSLNENDPSMKFTNYDANANGAERYFSSYAVNANAGDESFTGYSKNSNADTTFAEYTKNSNVVTSGFSGYSENGNGATNNFTSYGDLGNVPEQSFKAYGDSGNGEVDTFTTYRNRTTVGDDFFTSYAKKGDSEQMNFANYGLSFHKDSGGDNFTGYGEGSTNDEFNFTSYSSPIVQFKSYFNKEKGNKFTFKSYINASSSTVNLASSDEDKMKKSVMVNRWVEPGKFFRESNMKKGAVMPMPDIRDKMTPRSFLPRSIASKIPFSADKVRNIFRLRTDTAMGKAVDNTIAECERAPSRGETKRCATSAEDVIDFAVSVLGSDVVVRSTESTKGSKGNIMIGDVKGVNGGKVTESVSCHQSMFPYLVYYCHSVPKVRVYEADILTVDTKEKINRGVAICHLDTSDWSVGHGAFVALGSTPGRIEVCHWIFEGDMTWAVAD